MEKSSLPLNKERPDVRWPEFIAETRDKIATRLETEYPEGLRGGAPGMRAGKKFTINSVEGDAFAWVTHEELRLREEETEALRKEIFFD